MNFVTRFAPSPTGLLHRGHAFSALKTYRRAQSEQGQFILRIEDIDQTRCKQVFVEDLMIDLQWLGLRWEEPVLFQSSRFKAYADALNQLKVLGLIYPCFCTRADVKRAQADSAETPVGPDGPIYPGTCRALNESVAEKRIDTGEPYAWRLDVRKALGQISEAVFWYDEIAGELLAAPDKFGDVVLARKDTPTSYHLSVVVDDAFQAVTHVIRGMDLFEATHIHRLLQELLGLPVPVYHHHTLLMDVDGEKLAKRKGSESIKSLRMADLSAADFIRSVDNSL